MAKESHRPRASSESSESPATWPLFFLQPARSPFQARQLGVQRVGGRLHRAIPAGWKTGVRNWSG